MMSEITKKKLLPDLKVTIYDIETSSEDGEISPKNCVQDNTDKEERSFKNIEINRNWMKSLNQPREYKNKDGGFVTGLDLSSEELAKRLEERALRFGLEKKEVFQVTKKEIDDLYKSFDINVEDERECKLKSIRLDTIHIRGVNKMHTKDIFSYFDGYGASKIEWINDFSCNVIFEDDTTAARAILGMSKDLPSYRVNKRSTLIKTDKKSPENDFREFGSSNSTTEESDLDIDSNLNLHNDQAEIDVPVPPGNWRLGFPHPKAKSLLLRFASKNDIKQPGSEKRSNFYQKFGNPNYGGMKGIISKSLKHKLNAAKNRQIIKELSSECITETPIESTSDENKFPSRENQVKLPRMKMYADEEEVRRKQRINHPEVKSVYSRLGKKYTHDELVFLGPQLFEKNIDENNKASAVPSITCKFPKRFSIWEDIAKDMHHKDKTGSTLHDDRISYRLSPSKELKLYKSIKRTDDSASDSSYNESDSTDYMPSSKYKQERHTKRKYSYSESSDSSYSDYDLRSKIKKVNKKPKHRSLLCMDD